MQRDTVIELRDREIGVERCPRRAARGRTIDAAVRPCVENGRTGWIEHDRVMIDVDRLTDVGESLSAVLGAIERQPAEVDARRSDWIDGDHDVVPALRRT